MVVPMKTASSLSIEGEKIHVDSALLFQRLIAVYGLEELSTAFGYKLSTRRFCIKYHGTLVTHLHRYVKHM